MPTLKLFAPSGDAWTHEVKFDGWRVQIHKTEGVVRLYSKRGHDFTNRFPTIVGAVALIREGNVIIDGELTAFDNMGLPDFRALVAGEQLNLCVWCFDLLAIQKKDLRPLPYIERKARLDRIVGRVNDDRLRYSEQFDDPVSLMATCVDMKLEGIVSKRIDAPYRSGPSKDWIKVKTATWKETNEWRGEFFSKRKR